MKSINIKEYKNKQRNAKIVKLLKSIGYNVGIVLLVCLTIGFLIGFDWLLVAIF